MASFEEIKIDFEERGWLSIAYLQRKYKMSYERAAKILLKMIKYATRGDHENGVLHKIFKDC
jgi:DNA segregation ATPase FtsK/SpoIIIE-like protein